MHTCKLISDVVIVSDNKVLLVSYKDGNKYDHQKGWFLPDDLMDEFEHPGDAAKRILTEQLNIDSPAVKPEFVESFKGNDKSWHIVFHYRCDLPSGTSLTPSNEIEKMEWFSLDKLPKESEVAHHGWALFTIDEVTGIK